MQARHWTIAALACALLPVASAAQTGAGVEIERRPLGLHPSLEFGGALNLEMVDVRGGADPGLSSLANVDLLLDFDAERAGWWRGGKLHFFLLADAGTSPSPSERAGDVQTIRNLEAPDDVKLYEAYLEQRLGDRASLLVGLHDANTVFGDLATAALFHHSSFGIQPDLAQSGISIFPTTTLGVVLVTELRDSLLLEAGIYDGVPGDPNRPRGTRVKLRASDGAFSIAQMTRRSAGGIEERGADWAIGSWYQSAPSADPSGRERRGRWGVFSTYERHLRGDDRGRDLSVFAQAGWAPGEGVAFERYVGAGLVWTGPHPARPEDQVGLALGGASLSGAARAEQPGLPSAEWILEVNYSAALGAGFTVETDCQYVRHPAAHPGVPDARILGLRVVVEW